MTPLAEKVEGREGDGQPLGGRQLGEGRGEGPQVDGGRVEGPQEVVEGQPVGVGRTEGGAVIQTPSLVQIVRATDKTKKKDRERSTISDSRLEKREESANSTAEKIIALF